MLARPELNVAFIHKVNGLDKRHDIRAGSLLAETLFDRRTVFARNVPALDLVIEDHALTALTRGDRDLQRAGGHQRHGHYRLHQQRRAKCDPNRRAGGLRPAPHRF